MLDLEEQLIGHDELGVRGLQREQLARAQIHLVVQLAAADVFAAGCGCKSGRRVRGPTPRPPHSCDSSDDFSFARRVSRLRDFTEDTLFMECRGPAAGMLRVAARGALLKRFAAAPDIDALDRAELRRRATTGTIVWQERHADLLVRWMLARVR